MERYCKAVDLLQGFENGMNPLPDAAPDTDLVVRLGGADRQRLEAYIQLYNIRVQRSEQRLFADGADWVYVITWPGPMLNAHWKQRLPPVKRPRAKSASSRSGQ